jgi:antimicrobial peptide system SdpB family protein
MLAIKAIRQESPFTNVYGLARSLIALGTLLTLAVNSTDVLFRPMTGDVAGIMGRTKASEFSLFYLVDPTHLGAARCVAILLLLLTVIGWRPRITGIFHWWISFSLVASGQIIDGGDHVSAILSLLLIPVTLMDSRRWHWVKAEVVSSSAELVKIEVARSALLMMRIQVAVIYLHAAVAKLAVPEWANGTALYYWFTQPIFGAPHWLQPVLLPLVSHAPTVVILTWGAVLFEFLLAAGILMDRRYRAAFLLCGLAFHGTIALIHGLVSFFFAMAGALILYLRPAQAAFTIGLFDSGRPAGATRLSWARASRLTLPKSGIEHEIANA